MELHLSRSDAVLLACSLLLLALFVLAPEPAAPRLPELASLESAMKKATFFEFLEPVVARANDDVERDKARLGRIADKLAVGEPLTWYDRRTLERLAAEYEVEIEGASLSDDVLPTLARRIDTVPASLALVQAAKESGWGTSRFAVEGNNLYGQRCYSPDCGIAPRASPDARFAVTRFESVTESVTSYIRNLNTHPQYRAFRELRRRLRESGRGLSGMRLADGLGEYSERGEVYVAEIKSLIRQNDLEPH